MRQIFHALALASVCAVLTASNASACANAMKDARGAQPKRASKRAPQQLPRDRQPRPLVRREKRAPADETAVQLIGLLALPLGLAGLVVARRRDDDL